MTATADLLAFAAVPHVLPASVRKDALRLLADTLAVGAAGATAPGADAILSVARGFGTGTDARLLGSLERLPAASAAFVNGYRIHCLEWDAVHEGAVVHAMSVVTAALGAAIDRRGGCDADEALTALAVGVDISCGLGLAADSALSFFRPATAGLIGAAFAVARLERAPMADAVGLAYSQCAGTMQAHFEGSIALPFQVANAARAAVVAVDLAKAGFTAPHDVLEGPFGYFKLFDTGDLSRYTRDLGRVWRIGEISTKPFPSGRACHGMLGALQSEHQQLLPSAAQGRWRLAPEGSPRSAAALVASTSAAERGDPSALRAPPLGYAGEEFFGIEAHVPPLVHRLVGRPFAPAMTPAYARLCLPFLVALMLTDGVIDPRRFTPEVFADPAIARIAARVSVIVDDNPDPNALSPQRLVIDGESIAIPHTLGSPAAPLDATQADAKRDLCRGLAGAVTDDRLFDDPLAYFTDPR